MKKLAVISLQLAVLLFVICGQAWGVVDTLQPVADGVRVEWDHTGCDPGERYDCVDDPPGSPDENTYASTSVDGEEEFFQLETTSLSDIDSVVLRINGKKIGDGTAKLYVGWAYESESIWWWWTDDSVTLTTDWENYSRNLDDDPSWTYLEINARRFGVKSVCWDTTAWWDEDWDYRILLSCGNHDEYSTDDFLGITGLDVTGAKFRDDGNDIRIVYQPSGSATDLGRYLIGANTSTASIYWQVQATIPENEDIGSPPGDDYAYFMYYGNSGAGSPPAYTNTDCIDAPYSIDGNTVSLWHIEEASGALYDETENDNDMTVADGTFEQTGKFGKCVEYDGSAGDYAYNVWYEADPPAAAMTIAFWVYLDADSQVILGFNETSPGGSIYDRAFCVDGAGRIRWKVYEDPSGPTIYCVSTTSLSLSTWYHVAGVIDLSEGSILYINGSPEDTTAGTDGGYMGYTSAEFLMANEDGGGWGTEANLPVYFDGKIDEVCISNTARTNFHHIDNEATLTLGTEGTTAGAIPYLTQIFLMVYEAEPPEAGQVIIVH